uniref:Uncharacterized protein n=1 Tax=Prymnesium polylepis TaxID=72548 RepID=A0A7S4J7K8_9EUKA
MALARPGRAALGGGEVAHAAASASAVEVECVDDEAIRLNRVHYGAACTRNPPCGKMSFIPNEGELPRGCGSMLALPRTPGACARADERQRVSPPLARAWTRSS